MVCASKVSRLGRFRKLLHTRVQRCTSFSAALGCSHAKAHPAGSQSSRSTDLDYQKGVTPLPTTSYNVQAMSIAANGSEESQFAFARVLAALLSVPAALSVKFAFASAS